MTIEEIREKITPVLKTYGISKAGLFGSAARNEMRANSDIDIVVDIKKNIGLLEFITIKQKLEERLGKKVDLVEYNAIKPALKNIILQNQIAIL